MELDILLPYEYSTESIVDEKHSAKSVGSGDLEVLATPIMISYMENAAKELISSSLPIGYTTVGIEINVKHMKASLVGSIVYTKAKLERIEGKKLFYFIISEDDKGNKLGEGTHIRYIVNSQDFMKRI